MINKAVFRAKFYTNTLHPAKYRKKHQQKTHKPTYKLIMQKYYYLKIGQRSFNAFTEKKWRHERKKALPKEIEKA